MFAELIESNESLLTFPDYQRNMLPKPCFACFFIFVFSRRTNISCSPDWPPLLVLFVCFHEALKVNARRSRSSNGIFYSTLLLLPHCCCRFMKRFCNHFHFLEGEFFAFLGLSQLQISFDFKFALHSKQWL